MTLFAFVACSVAALVWASRLTAPEPDVLVVSFMASAVRAGLVTCANHPQVKAVSTVEVGGRVLAVCIDCLDLGDAETERGWSM